MVVTLAIDPGVNKLGMSIFVDRELYWAGLEKTPLLDESGKFACNFRQKSTVHTLISKLVVERPQVYSERSSVDPNDLISLAFVAGAMCCAFHVPVTQVLPRAWKGTVPKDVFGKRIVNRLTPNERQILDQVKCAASLKHNVIDAVGLCLWSVNRI